MTTPTRRKSRPGRRPKTAKQRAAEIMLTGDSRRRAEMWALSQFNKTLAEYLAAGMPEDRARELAGRQSLKMLRPDLDEWRLTIELEAARQFAGASFPVAVAIDGRIVYANHACARAVGVRDPKDLRRLSSAELQAKAPGKSILISENATPYFWTKGTLRTWSKVRSELQAALEAGGLPAARWSPPIPTNNPFIERDLDQYEIHVSVRRTYLDVHEQIYEAAMMVAQCDPDDYVWKLNGLIERIGKHAPTTSPDSILDTLRTVADALPADRRAAYLDGLMLVVNGNRP